MQKAKVILKSTGILEIVFGGILFLASLSIITNQIEMFNLGYYVFTIPIVVFDMFSLIISAFTLVTGILGVRYSNKADHIFIKTKVFRLVVGIIYCILALLCFGFAMAIIMFITGAFVLILFVAFLVVTGVLNIIVFAKSKKELIQENKISQVVEPHTVDTVVKTEEDKLDSKIAKISQLLEMKELGLISEEECNMIKNIILQEGENYGKN